MFVSNDHGLGALSALIDDFLDFAVNGGFYFFAIGLGVLYVRIGDVAELFIHAELGHESKGQIVGLLQVIICASCCLLEEVLLRQTSS